MRVTLKGTWQSALWALVPLIFLLLLGADRSAQYLDGFGANVVRAQEGAIIFRCSEVLGFFIALRFFYPRWITAAFLGLTLLGLPVLIENKIHVELANLSVVSYFFAIAFMISSLIIGLPMLIKSYREYREYLLRLSDNSGHNSNS